MSVGPVPAVQPNTLPAVRDQRIDDVLAKARRILGFSTTDRFAAYNLLGHTFEEAVRERRKLLMAIHEDRIRNFQSITKADIETCKSAMAHLDVIWGPVETAKHVQAPTALELANPPGSLRGDVIAVVLGTTDNALRSVRETVQRKVSDGTVDSAMDAVNDLANMLGKGWARFVERNTKPRG